MILNKYFPHFKQIKKQSIIIVFIILTFVQKIYAFNYSELWDGSVKTLENDYFSMIYPTAWMQFTYKSPGVDYVFNATGVGIPTRYNGMGVIAAVYIWRQIAQTEEEAIDSVLEQPNRAGNAATSSVKDFQGEHVRGKIIVSSFGKYFGGRNGVRYDFVTYSKKHEQYYGFTMLVQYLKKTENFVEKYGIQTYFEELLQHIDLKE